MRVSFSTIDSKSLLLTVVSLLSLLCVPHSTLGDGLRERAVSAVNPKGTGSEAQTPQCSLTLSQLPASPELFGFQLRMTREQVIARVPQIDFGRTDDLGASKTTINPDFFLRKDPTHFIDLRSISFDFLDDRVSSLWFGYESSFKWRTVPDFVAGISQSLHLPDAWEPWKTRGSRIRCADFQIRVSTLAGGASFHLLDDTAEQTIAARRLAKYQEALVAQADAESEIIADKRRRVYYSGGCLPANELKETDRVVFKTKEAAEKAGYSAAKDCQSVFTLVEQTLVCGYLGNTD